MNAGELIATLNLEPLPNEGGFFRETYRSQEELPSGKRAGTAIYYLITPDSYSAPHRLPTDEVWHFYAGDPVLQRRLLPSGEKEEVIIGNDVASGHRPQTVVLANVWQTTRLIEGGVYALLGTTMAPGFEFSDYEAATAEVEARLA